MTICKLCEIPLPPNYALRKCAFEAGFFSDNNWNCGTINALLRLMFRGEQELRSDCWRTRYNDSSLGVLAIPEDAYPGIDGTFIVLTWYKDHGACYSAHVMGGQYEPTKLTLEEAQRIITAVDTLEQQRGLARLR